MCCSFLLLWLLLLMLSLLLLFLCFQYALKVVKYSRQNNFPYFDILFNVHLSKSWHIHASIQFLLDDQIVQPSLNTVYTPPTLLSNEFYIFVLSLLIAFNVLDKTLLFRSTSLRFSFRNHSLPLNNKSSIKQGILYRLIILNYMALE